MNNEHDASADAQPTLGTDGGTFIPWSPSNQYFGHEFTTASPFSPNEFFRFCNALSSEVSWPEAKQGNAPEDTFKRPVETEWAESGQGTVAPADLKRSAEVEWPEIEGEPMENNRDSVKRTPSDRYLAASEPSREPYMMTDLNRLVKRYGPQSSIC